MSTYYRPRCKFTFDDIKTANERLSLEHQEENKGVPDNEQEKLEIIWLALGHNGSNLLYRNGAYLHFAMNKSRDIIDVFRYGSNNEDEILNPIDWHSGVSFVSEYDDDYMDYLDNDTPVVTIKMPLGGEADDVDKAA